MAEKFIPQKDDQITNPSGWIKVFDKEGKVGTISKEEQEQAKIDPQNPDFFTFTKEDEPALESMQVQEYQKEIDKIIMQKYRIELEKHSLHYENTFATNTKDGIPQKGAIYTEIQFSNKSNQKQIRKLKFDLKSQNGTAVLMNEKWESPLHTKLLGLTKEIAQTISRSIVRDFAQAHTKGKEFKMNIENGKLIIKTIPEAQEESFETLKKQEPENLDDTSIENLIQKYEELKKRHAEISKKIEILELAEENSDFSNTFEISKSKDEPYNVNTDEMVNNLINKGGQKNIEEEIQNENKKKVVNLSEYMKIQTGRSLNEKNWVQEKKDSIKNWVKNKFKRTLMALIVVGNFAGTTSFSYKYDDKALAYDKLKIENLDDWNNIKLYEEDINKLDNISIINEYQKSEEGKYLIVDKNMALAHLYERDSLISSYEVGTGLKKGDDQTETIVRNGKVYWGAGNMQTGAGIYKINHQNYFDGSPSFTLCNERGIEVPTVLHKVSTERAKYFDDGNTENNRITNGCINFKANDLEALSGTEGLVKDTKVYILPDDPHNKFVFVNGEVRFVSNEKDVNKTIRPYNPQPIIMKAEKINEDGKIFLQTLAEQKQQLMNIYNSVPNNVYNELAKIAYGIFGQESSFGTYGGPHGQIGRVTDKIGALVGKNISAGTTQIRLSSINRNVQEKFQINQTSDLFDVSKSSIATMSLLLDIYVNNIPKTQKSRYRELAALHYNNPKEFKNTIKNGQKQIENSYVKKVLKYSQSVKVYVGNYK